MAFITYKNIKVHYTSQGLGRVVVLLHGFLESSTMWSEVAPYLAKNHQVVSIDLLGHGQTASLAYVHTMEAQAEMVKYVLKQLGIKKHALIGHSMGGYVALAFANLFPERITQIVLLHSTALPDSPERLINRDRAIAMIKNNKNTFIKMAIPNLFNIASRKLFSEAITALKTEAQGMDIQGIVAAIEGMKIRKNRTEIYHNARFPILFIAGEKDTVLDFNTLKDEVMHTPVLFKVFPTGHMSAIENSALLIATLADFLKS